MSEPLTPFEQSSTGTPGGVALVTGAGSGVGAATALALARRGYAIALLGRRVERLEHQARAVRSLGAVALVCPADVREPEAVEEAVTRAVRQLGRLDVLVTAAGVARRVPLAELDPDTWRWLVETNLGGTYAACRAAAPHLRASGGAVVTVGSELAAKPLPGFAAYCAAKAAVVMLTKALALELAPAVRVNCVCPGPIDNEMLQGQFALEPDPSAAERATTARIPLGRLATSEAVAAAIAWIALEAPLATGSVLALDGGSSL